MKTNPSKKRTYDLTRSGTGAKSAASGTAKNMASSPAHSSSGPDLMDNLSRFMQESVRLFLHPAEASVEELQRPYGWVSGLVNLVPSMIFASLMVGLLVIFSPASILSEPSPAMVWAINSVLVVIGYLIMALLTLAALHLMARLAGGKGEVRALWHLLTKLLVVLNPLWLVAGILSAALPGVSVGAERYALAQWAVDLYFLWTVAQMLPQVYQLPKNKAILVAALFWLLSMAMWLVASRFAPAASVA